MSKVCVPINLLAREINFFRKGINHFGIKTRNFNVSVYYPNKHTVLNNNNASEVLTEEKANALASKLSTEERDILITALHKYTSADDKAAYEAHLAGLRWRSKFGRPIKLPTFSDVDPTGRYCSLPKDWFQRKSVENDSRPNNRDLLQVAFVNSVPFIAFGCLDNAIMIVAGDYIEMFLSNKFPVSTMAAAALGNTVSDVIGIGSTNWVENISEKIGFKAPKLSEAQLKMRITRTAVNMGRVVGITIGCLLGMLTIPIVEIFSNR